MGLANNVDGIIPYDPPLVCSRGIDDDIVFVEIHIPVSFTLNDSTQPNYTRYLAM
jgi:hypothetical protein